MNGEINEKYTGNYDCALTVTDSNSVNDQVGALYDIILFALTITEEEKEKEETTFNGTRDDSKNGNSLKTDISVKIEWTNNKG